MKKILVSKAEEIEIQFKDGVTREMVFNMDAVCRFQNAIAESGKKLTEIRDQNLLAFILYAGMNAVDGQNVSMEEANAMAFVMNPAAGGEITSTFIENIEAGMTAEQKLIQKKLMAQMLNLQTK